MSAPAKILELVERFRAYRESYKTGSYNETQLRNEFINPFFKELGWDIYNEKGYAEAYKDVIHEDALKMGASIKAPDYSFRIGGIRKFFVETKKPAVNIKQDTDAAFQLRRYAWSAKLPLSILTDFEEFAVYDCRVKPAQNDPAAKARVLYLTFEEYEKRWEEIASVFSFDAINKGSFDQYVEKRRGMRGTAEVDKAFLQEIERWRELLAKNIALRNPRLTKRELNYAVQKTIDRIVFLRICEDRGIERYGRLMALQNGDQVYKRMFGLFRKADNRYNSGLFHFRKESGRGTEVDELTPGLAVDDKVLKDIIKNLYYPDSPYEFSVLPADILGHVYEQFLGKVIRLTPSHRAVVEEKPEVRKAGGVYYTPTYIVDYIVEHTIGELVKDKKPGPRGGVSKLRILDPACGSGSFLLGAYQYLLDWHLKKYSEEPERWSKGKSPRIYRRQGGVWALTIDERKRILLNNIYGVDIDPQAVEVTKLSLLLKVLEGEDEKSIGSQIWLYKEQALPDLGSNIKCGNSLIGPDFYHGQQMSLLDEEEIYRINAFDWNKEFKEIMVGDGFDAVIGNPPYVLIASSYEREYLQKKFTLSSGKPDLYRYFIEKGGGLYKENGYFSLIVPNSLLTIPAAFHLREYMLQEGGIREIVNFNGQVFQDVNINSIIFLAQKKYNGPVSVIEDNSEHPNKDTLLATHKYSMPRDVWEKAKNKKFMFSPASTMPELINKILSVSTKLYQHADYTLGMQVYHNSMHSNEQIEGRIYHSSIKLDSTYFPESNGKNVKRYNFIPPSGSYVSYGDWCYNKPDWRFCEGPRILIREVTSSTLICSYSDSIHIPSKAVIIVVPLDIEIFGLLGVLNSKLLGFFVRETGEKSKQRLFPRVSLTTVKNLPVPDALSPDKARHDQMGSLVESMLDLHKKLATTKSPQEKTFLERQIQTTDEQIDQLVYELYGLTDEEIKIVEQATAS